MLLLGAAQHRVNESWVMANAAFRRLGVPCALPGCHLALQRWVHPRDRHHSEFPWLGPVHASPDVGWTWRDEGLPGIGLPEGGTSPSQGCLLPGDIFFPGTPPCGCLLPGDVSFPGTSPSQRHLLPGDIFLGTSSSWGPHLPGDVSFSGISSSWGPRLLPRDISFLGTSSQMPGLGHMFLLSRRGAGYPHQ